MDFTEWEVIEKNKGESDEAVTIKDDVARKEYEQHIRMFRDTYKML